MLCKGNARSVRNIYARAHHLDVRDGSVMATSRGEARELQMRSELQERICDVFGARRHSRGVICGRFLGP